MTISPPDTRISLIHRLRNPRDIAAWEEFVRLYARALYRVGRARGLQAADADNLVQEVLLSVARSIAKWLDRPDRGRFRPWLLRIARNEAIELFTRQHRSPAVNQSDAEFSLSQASADLPNLPELLDLEYQRAVFQWAAARVRESVAQQTWQAFWITHVEGCSVEEAATRLNTRTANIYFGRSRVMARIRAMVQHYGEQE